MQDLEGPAALRARLAALTELIRRCQPLWRPRPFRWQGAWDAAGRWLGSAPGEDPTAPAWIGEHPQLTRWLLARAVASDGPDEPLDGLTLAELARLDPPEPLRSLLAEAATLTRLPPAPEPLALAPEQVVGVRAHKRGQIAAMAGALLGGEVTPERLVELGAGKAHLGRIVAGRAGWPLTAIELQPPLAEQARERLAEAGVAAEVITGDLFERFDAHQARGAVCALHACGELTDHVVRVVADAGAQTDALRLCAVGCCFDKRRQPWAPLSAAGRELAPPLDGDALRLAVLADRNPRAAPRHRLHHEHGWRLALDALLRQAGAGAYTPLGDVRRELAASGQPPAFAAFARAVAEARSLALPDRWDPAAVEAEGHRRAREVVALSQVRRALARPIELAVTLDRALHLAEAGFDVRVRQLCPAEMTPRNVLIDARRD